MDLDGKRYKPQILKQGLMLVLIPFVVMSAILILLTQLCIKQERLCTFEQQQSKLLSRCVFTFNDWGETSAYLIGRAFSDEKSYEEGSISLVEKLRKEFAEISQPSAQSPVPKGIQKVETLCMDAIEELQSLPRASSAGMLANFDTLQRMPVIFNRLYSLPNKVKNLLEIESKNLRAARRKDDIQTERLSLLAWVFFVANIALSIGLIWYFSKGITSRLKVVTLNASLLPKLQKLDLKIGGNDELTYLGAVMQKAADQLIEAAEHRRAIFGMVTHDMRSPLNAAQLCLEVVEESFRHEPNENSNEDLKSAHEKIVGILKHVNALLAVESAQSREKIDSDAVPDGTANLPKMDRNELNLAANKTLTSLDEEAQQFLLNASSMSIAIDEADLVELKEKKSIWTKSILFFQDLLSKPRIFHKVLLLVLVPLFSQSVFLLLLNGQILTNNKLILQERKQSDMILNINIVFLDSLKATVAEAIYIVSGEPKIRDLAKKNFETAMTEFPMEDFFNNGENQQWLGILKSWRKMLRTHKDKDTFLDSLAGSPTPAAMKEKLKAIRPLQKSATKLRSNATVQFAIDFAKIHALQEEQLAARKRMTGLLGVALGFNFFMGIILLFAFNHDVLSRLKRVVSNAANLGTPGFAPAVVTGKDELAYLNLILQHTRIQLEKAANERAEMMSLIAVEMQKPLKDAEKSLQAFEQKEENSLTDRMKKQLTRAQHNINRVLFLLNDLLTMETLETGRVGLEHANCNVRSFVEEAVATVSSLAKQKSITVRNECDTIEIKADKMRLIQTVINYLANAIKFSPNNSSIVVTNSPIRDGRVRVNVIDEGVGMDEATRARVFERFFQAEGEQKQKGFGLGLAICTLIIESHGGRLGVESELGKGSCFWFEVPINQ